MEAWHFFNYTVQSPLISLLYTTERWNLAPFPANLAATSSHFSNLSTPNGSIQAWTLPYSPSEQWSTLPEGWTADGPDQNINSDPLTITNTTYICSTPHNNSCLILIEGIGANTIGPTHSSITSLTHGLGFLFALIFATLFTIMGSKNSKLPQPEMAHHEAIRTNYTPAPVARHVSTAPPPHQQQPPPPKRQSTIQQPQEYKGVSPNSLTSEIAHCASLLRELYALDLSIWGMQNCVRDEIPRRQTMERKANALFREIRRMTGEWRASVGSRWSMEDRQAVETIWRAVHEHPETRY
ncbi:hypothetical protein BT63DRAFT_423677 [Microthyrium microscopicum]|uniref:Uncharacterized protein n=1 Tax=Microthyrium microscopicum TaxID=703497 RepID=A0A6A6UJ37_9PEZI|nr:hypothetical protein BT63DRAFT_423677 [Microthyrium microscopicum]